MKPKVFQPLARNTPARRVRGAPVAEANRHARKPVTMAWSLQLPRAFTTNRK